MERSYRQCAPKASPRPLFNFVKLTQNSHCMQEILLEKRYFEKALKKLTSFFLSNPFLFMGQS